MRYSADEKIFLYDIQNMKKIKRNGISIMEGKALLARDCGRSFFDFVKEERNPTREIALLGLCDGILTRTDS